jgi:hypothetical protein
MDTIEDLCLPYNLLPSLSVHHQYFSYNWSEHKDRDISTIHLIRHAPSCSSSMQCLPTTSAVLTAKMDPASNILQDL